MVVEVLGIAIVVLVTGEEDIMEIEVMEIVVEEETMQEVLHSTTSVGICIRYSGCFP
jgi:hypothetical protein